ncbi:non-ribosomal peptide synthetase [Collimonas fungivorans]|uniref:Peptide synthetase n=1 Tax=Collimonas fungivorans (strain Ter331) TaxID=1005048 RepID=G0AK86_COLFT|nr:non-ribosomal peptide synthetase [Collimonas fungivorans]AEK62013.1 Peptide synthetase [Collimonas fungivorans Ter331]
MSARDLLDTLDAIGIALRADGDKLSVIGDQKLLADRDLIASLRGHKSDLIALLQQRAAADTAGYLIAEGTQRITPAMLPLVELGAAQIEALAQATPGGAANIQDIYQLAPLQEGILFHHRLQSDSDAYVLPTLLRFDSRQRLDRFVQALNQVIARHDILRTAMHWEGLKEPVQLVQRQASLAIQALVHDASAGDAISQLQAHADPRQVRLDVRQAPMLRAYAMPDGATQSWLLQLLHHHLVLDHTASQLLVQEIMLILQGRQAELTIPVPFRRFVTQARLGMGSAEHETYFRRVLGNVDQPTAPFGLLDVQGDGSQVRQARSRLEPALARRLRQQAQARGVSCASLFHLAWARTLACFTGRDDVVFGTVLFGRLQGGAGAARAMGMFLNTLPLRVQLDQLSVEQGLRQTHAALIELLRHEHASLTLAQRCSSLPANLPLFTSLLNYRYSHEDGADSTAMEGIEHLGGHDRTNYPFALHVDDLGEGFELCAEIDVSVSAQRVCEFMQQVVRGLVQALEQVPHMPLQAIETMPAAERHQLIDAFNRTAAEYPRQLLLHQLFEQQTARQPQATAVQCEGHRLSYAALNARANHLARRLRTLGVGPDAKVGIFLERNEAMVVALLATLKAGGAYVPLDPAYPDGRLEHMLRDCAPVAVLTEASLASRLPGQQVQLLVPDTDPVNDEGNLVPAELGLTENHLAYVIYTSGSTGQPKGVMNEHRGIVNRIQWMQQAYRLAAHDVVLQKTPFSFDVSVWEFFWPLMAGAQLVMARPGGHKDPSYLSELIRGAGVTTLHFVPSMLQVFLNHGEAAAACASVARVICSGEALPAPLARQFLAQLPHAGLHNLYGPTEAAVDVTAWTCAADDQPASVPIGRPIANTRIYLLDERMQPTPLGVTGELYIGGVQVARGYLNQPALTEQRFLADPFVEGGRIYRTGDLGRWRDDGAIDYLGRNDFQVKIRGFRIELGEIDGQLAAIAGVREAVVIAREDGLGGQRLVAYVVAEPDAGQLDPAALRAQLGLSLPDYMLPAAYVQLDSMPLTANGKLDRQALPAPEGDAFKRQAYEAPDGEIELVLAQIWSELLGVERVGRHDSFFELGGHSLLAVQLLERLRCRRWTIDIRALFAQPSLAAMAAAVTRPQTPGIQESTAVRKTIPAQFAALDSEQETEEFRL